MESSRHVIENQKQTSSIISETALARERRPRHTTTTRADTTAPAQVSKVRTLSTPLPRGPNETIVVGGDKGSYTRRAPTSGGATCRCAACPRSSSGSISDRSCGRPRRRAPCGSSSSGPSFGGGARGPGPPGHRGPARCAAAVETTTGAPTRLCWRRAFVSSPPALERHSSIFQRTCPWRHRVSETSSARASRRPLELVPAACRREAPPPSVI